MKNSLKTRKPQQLIFYLGILLLLNLIIFLPTLFEPTSYGDECIYLTLGQAFKKGLTFYKDIHDNKPPLLYLAAALANARLFSFRLISLFWNFSHVLLIFFLVEKITNKRKLSLLAGILFTLAGLLFESKIANGEVFMMMPATLAVYLIFDYPKKKSFFFGSALGFLFSLGFLFKVPLIFDFVGILFALYILTLDKLRLKNILKNLSQIKLWGMIFGFLFPIAISIIYYASKGAFTPYLRSALMQNVGYLASWQGSNQGLINRFILLTLGSIMLFVWRQKLNFHLRLFFSWFIFALFGALLSARPYPHYLFEILPSLTVLTVLAIEQKKFQATTLATIAYFFILASYLNFGFWRYPFWPDYKRDLLYLFKKIDYPTYLSLWGERTASDYQLANFIRERTDPEDRIFLWGDGSCVYSLSQRLPVGRYTVNYHIYDFNGFQETLEAIEKQQPRIIVKLKDESQEWPELDSLLLRDYRRLKYDDFSNQIFLRNK